MKTVIDFLIALQLNIISNIISIEFHCHIRVTVMINNLIQLFNPGPQNDPPPWIGLTPEGQGRYGGPRSIGFTAKRGPVTYLSPVPDLDLNE